MYEQEKKRQTLLILMISQGLFDAVLLAEGLLYGWDVGDAARLLLLLAICFIVHLTGKVSESVEQWFYFALDMAGLLYMSRHVESVFEMSAVVILLIFVYCVAGEFRMVNLGVLMYFAFLILGILFAFRDSFDFTPRSAFRLLLHGIFVFMAAYLGKLLYEKQKNWMADTGERIERLEEMNRRTEDFLTNVSHELRTPVNAVTGLASLMLKGETDQAARENLESIQRAGYRLFEQVEDILDYTEIDTGSIAVSEEAYMMSSLINDIISEKHLDEENNGIELIFDVDARIPAVLSGDPRKVKKIIRHLLDNSFKFTKAGGIYIRIYALEKPYGINLCIQVRDTGIGMDGEALSKVTERFYQSSHGRDRMSGGLGLGLPVVYGMASAMEGFVHVDSKPGVGTTVSVSIPQKVEDAAPGMAVHDPAGLCVGCYLMPEKYKIPEVRRFYDEMIGHLAEGLDVQVHRVFNRDELDMLASMYRLTHLFIGREEYESDPEYFEGLDRDIMVVAIAERGFMPREGSRVKCLPKPFYCFPIVGTLNSTAADYQDVSPNRRMTCPDVRMLVVDDEPMNLMVAEGIFRDYQMKVRTASSGREAIDACRKEEFDVLFIDHMMPEMDGIETLRQIIKLNPEATDTFTAVAFTANAVSGAREMFLREGFDDFLPKPIEIPELERVLKKVLPKSRIKYTDAWTGETGAREAGAAREPVKDAWDRLAQSGVNTSSGMNYCRNDRDFYKQLLLKFAGDAQGKADEIERLYGEKDYANYRIQVHSLKSTAKMVGADELSQTAKEMEDAAKNEDGAYIKSHHRELLEEYEAMARSISSAFEEDEEDAGGESGQALNAGPLNAGDGVAPDSGGPASGQILVDLRELKEALDMYEADRASKALARLSSYGKTDIDGELRAISSDIAEFELEAASEKAAGLLGRLA